MPVNITERNAATSRGVPSTVDTLFVPMHTETAGLSLTAAIGPLRSITDYVSAGATRAMNTRAYDGLEAFFREDGKQAYVARYTTAGTYEAALANFVEEYGGGQVVLWDETPDDATNDDMKAWARDTGRFFLADVNLADDTVAELTTTAGLMTDNDASYGAMFGPWVKIPPLSGGVSERDVPASAVVAGLIARSDALGNPNAAPAGRDFPLQYATGIIGAPISDANAAALRTAGLNPLRRRFGLDQLDGFQTSIARSDATSFWQANAARARMWLRWQAKGIGLNYEYKTIDGRGRLQRALQKDIDAVCLDLWNANGLFGATREEAWASNVSASLNTEDSIAQGELNVEIEARFSLHALDINVALISVPILGRVSTAPAA